MNPTNEIPADPIRQEAIRTLMERGVGQRKDGAHAAALATFQAVAQATDGEKNVKIEIARELRALNRLIDAEEVLCDVLAQTPNATGALVEWAYVCRQQGNHVGALTAFQSAATNHPDHLGLQLEVVRTLRTLGRLADADARLDQALALNPRDLGGLIERGHMRRARGDHAAALAAFEEAAEVNPGHVGIRIEVAISLRAVGRPAEAEALLRRVLAGEPAHAGALLGLARLMAADGRLADAAEQIDGAPASLSGNAAVASFRLYLARAAGDGEKTVALLERVVALDPANLDARLDLAGEKRRSGELDAASQVVAEVLAAHPRNVRALLEKGYIARAHGDREAASAAFSAVLKHDPNAIQAQVELAHEAWATGKVSEARAHLEQALNRAPTDLAALLVSAERTLRSGDAAAAVAFAERAIAAHPDHAQGYLLAARAAANVPDRPAALAFIDAARSRFGERPDISASLIYVLRALGDHRAAAECAAALGAGATHESLWAEVVALRIYFGELDAAEELLSSLSAAEKDAPRAHFFRGQLAEARRQYPQAMAAYQRALASEPANGGWHGEMARAALLALDLEAARDHLRLSVQRGAAFMRARGQALNPSQHHVGQLLDEFVLDGPTAVQLGNIIALPDKAQVARLMAVVRDHPDNTAAATMLALALRRTGLLAGARKRRVRSSIPRRVVQFWDTKTIPDDLRPLVGSWDEGPEGYRHDVYDDHSAAAFVKEHFPAEVGRAIRRARHPAQRADIFRLAYLAKKGGIYVDADDRRAGTFAALVPAGATFVAYQENYGTIANDFLAAAPLHPVIERALALAVAAVNRGDADTIWLSTGPGLLTRAFAAAVADAPALLASGTVVRELFEMHHLADIHCPARYKSTPRHWSRAESAGTSPPVEKAPTAERRGTAARRSR